VPFFLKLLLNLTDASLGLEVAFLDELESAPSWTMMAQANFAFSIPA